LNVQLSFLFMTLRTKLVGPDLERLVQDVRNLSPPLGQFLNTLGVEAAQIAEAVKQQNDEGQEYHPLGTILVERGVCDMPTVHQALEMQEGNGRS
jgi:hypothetical protein